MQDETMHWTELVEQARELDDGAFPFTDAEAEVNVYGATLAAVETIWGHGFADDQLGDVDNFNHYIRVNRWTLETDSCGHRYLEDHGSERDAMEWWRQLEREYAEWEQDADNYDG